MVHTQVYIEVLHPGRGRQRTWGLIYPYDRETAQKLAEHWVQRFCQLTGREANIGVCEAFDALPGKFRGQPDRQLHKALRRFGMKAIEEEK